MWKYAALAGGIVLLVMGAQPMLQNIANMSKSGSVSAPEPVASENLASNDTASDDITSDNSADRKKERRNPLSGRVEELDAGPGGHFMANARLNGYKAEVLVDTGATYVAMGRETAQRMGISLKPSEFKYQSSTANGIIRMALVKMREIQIGRIVVRDVPVAVSEGNNMDGVLLGMSFLSKLKKFESVNGKLVLTQ